MADERTPLLGQRDSSTASSAVIDGSLRTDKTTSGLLSPYSRLLLTTLLLSTAFTFTSSTLLYAVRVAVCDLIQGKKGGEWEGAGDRCASPAVDARTAKEVSLMATLTTAAGILNLFTTGWVTKRYGVRRALVFQSFWPCVRLFVQTWAIITGGLAGIRAFRLSQLITIAGGGSGYMLTTNTYCVEVVEPDERTPSLGRLQGVMMFGTAIGLMTGGLLGTKVHAAAPFLAAMICLALSTVVNGLFLPYIPPAASSDAKTSGGSSLLAPAKVFSPRRLVSGRRWYGLLWLWLGAFTSVFATSFIPLLLQLVGTNLYGFKADLNGELMALAALSRGAFLSLAFSRLIGAGRRWYAATPSSPSPSASSLPPPPPPQPPTTFNGIEPLEPVLQTDVVLEPPPIVPPTTERNGSHFDLLFLRLSILLDAALTACLPLSSQGWHLFAAAGILPLASGTAPAAKGVVLEMVTKEEQADALQGISLGETLAMMLTISVSGWVFSELSEVGRALDVFYLNAATALLSFLILLLVRFPPSRPPSV